MVRKFKAVYPIQPMQPLRPMQPFTMYDAAWLESKTKKPRRISPTNQFVISGLMFCMFLCFFAMGYAVANGLIGFYVIAFLSAIAISIAFDQFMQDAINEARS